MKESRSQSAKLEKMLLRRGFLRLLSSAVLGRGFAPALEVERVLRDHPLSASPWKAMREYRADASVMFLGMTIVRRQNVGGGFIQFEEAHGEASRRTAITFKAGSLPSRARGLNRLGFIQEVCVEENSALREAAYFGFMTSSPEESFADAKNALDQESKEGLRYTAIDGVNRSGQARSSSHHWVFPSDYDWSRRDALIETALQKTRSVEGQWRQFSSDGAATPDTFLNAVLKAYRAEPPKSHASYIFGEKRYKLSTDKTGEANGITRLKGEILNEASGKKTNFSAWFEANNTLPSRIEFQPRSYLRLTFEAV